MAKHINNMDDLAIALQPVMKKMVDNMANRVYETLNFFLQRYYDSYDPIFYRRQYDFLRSGFKVDARIIRGKAVASVYIDVDYMSNYYGVNQHNARDIIYLIQKIHMLRRKTIENTIHRMYENFCMITQKENVQYVGNSYFFRRLH